MPQAPAWQEYGSCRPASFAASRIYVSPSTSMSCVPVGMFRVTLKALTWNLTAVRLGLGWAVRKEKLRLVDGKLDRRAEMVVDAEKEAIGNVCVLFDITLVRCGVW